ncbi:SDR family NAD(P)-dependent oxidoreductase [Rubrolithibacter danxiaensis]|uniref:SDR family NAD(P)-dependent oxidoreductase n=1 Tax=Rubrolithibacter danxiaensis TaxID=3390805 RepID=UPI003BF7E96C
MTANKKYALITGATSGIGYELAKLFAKDQFNLVIVARSEEELQKTSQELKQQYNVEVVTIAKDLFKREAPFEIYDEAKAKGIRVDVLVNDAGQGEFGKFAETDINRELDIIQLNIGAYVALTKCFLKDMIQGKDGKILNVGSIAGEAPGPWQSVYHGTKAFVNSWTEAIRNELKDTGVSVTCLLPGTTDTDFFNKADMESSKLVQEGKMADPATVAKDGYDALLAGEGSIISGFKNKMMVGMGKVLPDSISAEQMNKQQAPADKK